jgi:hypothetical protein
MPHMIVLQHDAEFYFLLYYFIYKRKKIIPFDP